MCRTGFALVLLTASATLLCGCNPPTPPTGNPTPPWPAVDKFEGVGSNEAGHYYAIDVAAGNNNWAEAQKIAASPEFEKHLDEFAGSALPAAWSSFAAERDQVVAACKALIETARKGSSKDFQTAYAEFSKTFRAMKMKKLGAEKSAPK